MAGARILIVEDDGFTAAHLESILTRLGYHILGAAASGEEAIQEMDETSPDLVLMDIYLAGDLNGIETAAQVRARFGIPVVYLTGHSEDTLFQQAKITEPYGYLVKPIQERELRAAIEMALYRHEIDTRRKQAEEALRESEERYRHVVEYAGEAIIVAQDGLLKFFNPKTLEVTGYSHAELSSTPFVELIHPEDREMVVERHLRRLRGDQPPDVYSFRIIDKTGEVKWLEISAVLIDWEGKPATLNFLSDITERKLAEEERHARERYLTLLNDITRTALEALDLQTMLQALAERLGGLLDADGCYIALWDEEQQRTITAAAYGALRETYPTIHTEPGEVTMIGSVLCAGHPLVAEDALNSPYVSPRIARLFPARSLLGLPLIADGQMLGAALIAFEQPHRFTPEEIARGEQTVRQIALAVAKARALEDAERRAQEAETLRQAGAVVAATLEQDEAIQRILEQLERVVPCDSITVQLLREGYLEIVGGRGWPDLAAVVGLRFPVPGDNPNTVVIQQRRPHILCDAPAAHAPFHREPHSHIRSWLGVPLIVHEQVIGMLAVDSSQPDHFTADHARLAAAFANQVAIALENARLFEAERRRSGELEALRQASLRLTSRLELQTVMETVLDQALKLAASDNAHIFLYDGERLRFGAALWTDGRQRKPYAEPRSDGLTYTVARSGEPVVVPDVNSHPLFRDLQWGGAIAGLPLLIGDQVCGVMNVAFDGPHAFDEDELRVLGLLADQAAIVIRNAQLHAEVQELAITDDLTGLYNRRGFFELGRREVERARRFGRSLTAIMFDLDGFKRVNDAYGHAIGDQVLTEVTARCQEELRHVDLLGRYGGEEFTVLLPETDLVDGRQVAERLRQVVSQTAIDTDAGPVTITVSLGIATLDRRHENLEALLECADRALYMAKQAGRNRVSVCQG
ncbi:MAG: diguanylate cyclase [Anaerolineae bacterium]